jgi:hypothetical protein
MFMTTSCGNNLKFYGSFCGRVIDYKTGEPIEGAVVAASWNTLNFTDQNHSFTRPAKVAEVVSNKAGEFCLYGRGLALFPYQPSVEIFKAGYKSIQTTYYPNFYESSYYKDSITWENGIAHIKLKKIAIEDRAKQLGSPGDYISHDTKFKNERKKFDEEIAKESAELNKFWDQQRKTSENDYMENRGSTPNYGTPPASGGAARIIPYQEGGIPESDVTTIMSPKNPQRINK